MSGQKDSNLRPPAPKAGALAGLRHTPKKKTTLIVFPLSGGEGGIRTPGTPCGVRQFSKLLVSATHPPLREFAWIAGAKIGIFLLSPSIFCNFFQKNIFFIWFSTEYFFCQMMDNKQKNPKNCLLFKYFLYLQALFVEPKVGELPQNSPCITLKNVLKWKTTNN